MGDGLEEVGVVSHLFYFIFLYPILNYELFILSKIRKNSSRFKIDMF